MRFILISTGIAAFVTVPLYMFGFVSDAASLPVFSISLVSAMLGSVIGSEGGDWRK